MKLESFHPLRSSNSSSKIEARLIQSTTACDASETEGRRAKEFFQNVFNHSKSNLRLKVDYIRHDSPINPT